MWNPGNIVLGPDFGSKRGQYNIPLELDDIMVLNKRHTEQMEVCWEIVHQKEPNIGDVLKFLTVWKDVSMHGYAIAKWKLYEEEWDGEWMQ